MKIYIAGGSDERLTVVRPMVDHLAARGYTITHDWTRCEGYDREHTDEERLSWAGLDFGGVASADVVWVMTPAAKSEGAGTEIGAALALGKRVVVSGPHARRNIFALLAGEIYDTHGAALAALEGGI